MKKLETMKAVVVCVVLCQSLSAQRTWRVNCAGGPNVDFTDLPPAVAAAAPGDTILLIRDAQSCPLYFRYSATTIDKSLAIVGASSFGVPGSSTPLRVLISGLMRIQGIDGSDRVSISNVSISPGVVAPNVVPPPHGVHVTDCSGEVLLEDVFYHANGVASSMMRFERCQRLVLRGCEIRLSGEPITLVDSQVVVSTTFVEWQAPASWPYVYYTHTGPGLHLQNSHATLLASVVYGASVANYNPWQNYIAHDAVVVGSGTLVIGPYTLLRGGSLGWGGQREYSFHVEDPNTGQVHVDPRAEPVTYWGTQPVTTVTTDATFHNWVVGGETYRVSTAGPAGGWGLMAVGGGAIQPVTMPGIGLLAIDPGSLQVLGLQALDPVDGWAEWISQCPSVVPVGTIFAFQAALLAPNGTISLAAPSPFTVAWPHGWVP